MPADTDALSTLPPRELSAGLAEVIKYGLLGDIEFLDWLEAHMDALMARAASLPPLATAGMQSLSVHHGEGLGGTGLAPPQLGRIDLERARRPDGIPRQGGPRGREPGDREAADGRPEAHDQPGGARRAGGGQLPAVPLRGRDRRGGMALAQPRLRAAPDGRGAQRRAGLPHPRQRRAGARWSITSRRGARGRWR